MRTWTPPVYGRICIALSCGSYWLVTLVALRQHCCLTVDVVDVLFLVWQILCFLSYLDFVNYNWYHMKALTIACIVVLCSALAHILIGDTGRTRLKLVTNCPNLSLSSNIEIFISLMEYWNIYLSHRILKYICDIHAFCICFRKLLLSQQKYW